MYRYRFKVYRYRSPKSAHNVYFLPFFMHFSIPNQIYTSYTLQNHFKFILYPQLYSNHLSMDIFLPNSFMNHFKNHSNMGYNPYTNQIQRFVNVCSKPLLNYLQFNMNPSSKRGFHDLLVLFKVLPTLLSIICFGITLAKP